MAALYETDYYAWTQEQIKLLREGKWEVLDVYNLIEEIDDLGKSVRREIRNRLGILLGHLLKWQYQPDGSGKSWAATIREQRRQIKGLLQENPSLQSYLKAAIVDGYQSGLNLIDVETPLESEYLPAECPYSTEQILDDNFYPS